MATVKVALDKPWRIGEGRYTEAELREPTAGDYMDAVAEAERAVPTPAGWQLLASPTLVGWHILRRQIVGLAGDAGDTFDGVVTLDMLRGLDTAGLEALQGAAAGLETAGLEEAERRGRDPAPPEGAG